MEHFFRKLHAILHILILSLSVTLCAVSTVFFIHTKYFPPTPVGPVKIVAVIPKNPPFDALLYDYKLMVMANYASSAASTSKTTPHLWPVQTGYPNVGAILPFSRIIAYYGNMYSKNMGVLGQYPREEMLERLMKEVKNWHDADPTTPVIPALHYIAVTAQGYPGADKKYRLRMPGSQIDKTIEMARGVGGLVFLDIQVGKSTLEDEIPPLDAYLKMPQVHLGIDPEFSMKTDKKPGAVIGT